MVTQPTGAVTLLFSDVEGSTRLLERLGTDLYAEVLELHRRLLREAFARLDGFEFGTEGDAFFVAFARPDGAVGAAGEAQRALASSEWPDGVQLRVRMGVHTGQPVASKGNYVGMDLHRVARIMSAGHGGQVLVSESTAALVEGVGLRDLGEHRLKDLLEPIRLYQLEIDGLPDEFPPLRSLHRSNLPVAAWPLLGRERELEEIGGLVKSGTRLITLTGPGGSGKTRLALQAAGELADEFSDGVFFVGLAPLRDTRAVRTAVAEAIGLQPDDEVAGWLGSRGVLLVLDNLEHLSEVEEVVADLLVGGTVILATSRAPLRLSAQREFPVEPLPERAAVELFVSRAAAAGREVEGDRAVAELCRRLDNLPLAIELAAARSRLLAPSALLERLGSALPLLTGGGRDLPERQQTLRATIEWSHALLDPEAQAAFRRLSVFRGSFTLETAEVVTGVDFEQVAGLVDQSLLKTVGQDRFFLLETLREYARERLADAGEATGYALRHAYYYLDELQEAEGVFDTERRQEAVRWFGEEEDNLRAMLDRLIELSIPDAVTAADLLRRFWVARFAHSEARERLHELLSRSDVPDEGRARLLNSLSEVEEWLGHLDAADQAGRAALELAESTGETRIQFYALRNLAWVADRRGDSAQAVRLQSLAVEVATSDEGSLMPLGLHDLGVFLRSAQRPREAHETLLEAAAQARAMGNEPIERDAAMSLGDTNLYAGDFEAAYRTFSRLGPRWRGMGAEQGGFLISMAWAALGVEHREEARALFAEALDLMLDAAMTSHYDLSRALSGIALTADAADLQRVARLLGAIAGLRERSEFTIKPEDRELERQFEQPVIDKLAAPWEDERSRGADLSLEEIVELARSLAPAPPPAVDAADPSVKPALREKQVSGPNRT